MKFLAQIVVPLLFMMMADLQAARKKKNHLEWF